MSGASCSICPVSWKGDDGSRWAIDLQELRLGAARAEAESARRAAEEARKQFDRERLALTERQQAFDRWAQAVSNLRPGDKVHVQRFDRSGQIVRVLLHKQLAVVSVGAMEIEVPLRELTPA